MRQSELIKICLLSLLFLPACTKEKREAVTGSVSMGSSGPATLSTIQSDIFRLGCAVSGCHDNRTRPAGNLSLANAQTTYTNLISRKSTQALNRYLVVPADPDKSYLIDKLRGTHLLVGGSGARMPQYAAAMNASDIDRIAQWITDGAQKN